MAAEWEAASLDTPASLATMDHDYSAMLAAPVNALVWALFMTASMSEIEALLPQ